MKIDKNPVPTRSTSLGTFRWVPPGRHRANLDAPTVTVERGFWCGEVPITQAAWKSVTGSNPSAFRDDPDAPHRPVERVSWDDVQAFLRQAAERDGLPYRLLTADEWERAALGGTGEVDGTNEFVGAMPTLYAGSDDIDAVAWHAENSGGTTHPVGQKQPNGYGLCDMSGNVWEWTSTEWTSTASGSSRGRDRSGLPRAAPLHPPRVNCGGSWCDDPAYVRVAHFTAPISPYRTYHHGSAPRTRRVSLGLRVALDAEPAPASSDLAALIAEVERLRVELEQERAAVVAWLRFAYLRGAADAIERGDHRKEEP